MTARCGSCTAAIVWATTDNGRAMPLNALPDPEGNVAVRRENGDLHARVLKAGETAAPWERLGTSHHATCPSADLHRKRKAGARGG